MEKLMGLALLLIGLTGCGGISDSGGVADDNPGSLKIVTWNVQALFDGEETGNEYDEYLYGAGWTKEKYAARVISLAQAIAQMPENGPDILALQEVENSKVLKDLAEGALSNHGYLWTSFANNPGASLGVGILSRFPFTVTKAHSVTSEGDTIPRPILEVWLTPKDRPLVLFICHWKSKLGGDDEGESLRRASARVILRRLGEIKRDVPNVPVIILGDLNENHDEFYRGAGSLISALLPDDPKAAELTGFWNNSDAPPTGVQSDFLIISREKPPRAAYFPNAAAVFYSPWTRELKNGSYSYKNEWETIDHFLLPEALFDNTGWDFESCTLMDIVPFINAKGLPYAYNPHSGQGLSDHLPLLLSLTAR
jgi:endonuclease/exonuclease/phosphatase family metal-dependent hydrolase